MAGEHPVMSVIPQDARERTLTVLRTLGEGVARRPGLVILAGAFLSLWMALANTAGSVGASPAFARGELYLKKEDIYYLYNAASHAGWRDVLRWWTGPWLWPGVDYYRPVTSMLYLAEYRLFHSNFTYWNAVSWVLHGINAVLLYLFAGSLFRRHGRAAPLLGLVAVRYFATDHASLSFAFCKVISWWPAQNDDLSLTFGLLSLLLLDLYLCKTTDLRPQTTPVAGGADSDPEHLDARTSEYLPGSGTPHPESPLHPLTPSPPRPPRWLIVASILSMALSICSKEMGFIVMPIALALVLHRKRRLTVTMVPITAVALGLWYYRKAVLPHPWAPVFFRRVILNKLISAWGGPVAFLMQSSVWWAPLSAIAVLLVGLLGIRLRWRALWIGIACVVTACLASQLVWDGQSWILWFIDDAPHDALLYLMGAALFWTYRRQEPGIFAAAALLLCYVPILQYGGHHYFYWPGAFLGLADAVFCACLWRWAVDLRRVLDWSLPPALAARFRTSPDGTAS